MILLSCFTSYNKNNQSYFSALDFHSGYW